MSVSEAAYRHAAILSESAKQTAICNAMADYLKIADDVPALVRVQAGQNPSPEDTEAASIEVNGITAEAMAGRDAAIRKAEQDHVDRLAAAGRHYGIINGARGNADAPHAVAWLKRVTGQ